MQQYIVTGMSCAACSARVEKAVNAVPGVTSCSVSLLTNSMGVEGSASGDAIIEAVQNAGYGAKIKGADVQSGNAQNQGALEEELVDHTTFAKALAVVGLLFASTYVFFYGAYDVELAGAEMDGRESCGDGAGAAPVNDNRYGDQSEVFYQRL